jgi:hypothetical protein
MVRVIGWFNPLVGEVYEMLYQNESPYLFDSSKFAKAVVFSGTPYSDAIAATAASFKRSGLTQRLLEVLLSSHCAQVRLRNFRLCVYSLAVALNRPRDKAVHFRFALLYEIVNFCFTEDCQDRSSSFAHVARYL